MAAGGRASCGEACLQMLTYRLVQVAGAGWGVRLKLAVMTGCIPVVVADEIEVKLSDHIKLHSSARSGVEFLIVCAMDFAGFLNRC